MGAAARREPPGLEQTLMLPKAGDTDAGGPGNVRLPACLCL